MTTMKLAAFITALALVVILAVPAMAQTAAGTAIEEKELNLVFMHGAGGSTGSMQLLSDMVLDRIPVYVAEWETAHPGFKLRISTLNRDYPNDADIDKWANNVARDIGKYSHKKNLVLIGHSMGGKTALYMTAHNVGEISDNVLAVVTINSPIRAFNRYYFVGGVNYWQAVWALPQDNGTLSSGVLSSIASYDSVSDGKVVGTDNHWLAFISGESSPSSPQFDVSGIDPLPRDMDDEIVPISAQYADGADVIYYGEHAHGDFTHSDELSGQLADQILRYIFDKRIDVSLPAKNGTFQHEAGWMPVVENFEDQVGSTTVNNGQIVHKNDSSVWFQDWQDVVGIDASTGNRDNYTLRLASWPVLTGIVESGWQGDNPEGSWIYVKTRAAPGMTVKVDWSVSMNALLAKGFPRDHYEVEIASGTPFTAVDRVTWVSENTRDQRLKLESHAEGPFRFFNARWRTYVKIPRIRNIIGQMK
jgi:pimeloyl-ACP methyl ester carboxylesterase